MSQVQATEDHYATLGVAPRSEAAEIRAAYLALMRRFHPDRNDSPEAVERAHAIIAAFAVLGNVEKRLHYDWVRRRAADAAAMPQRRWPVILSKALAAGAVVLLVAVPLSFLDFPQTDSDLPVAPPVTKIVGNDPIPKPSEEVVTDPLVAQIPVAAPQPLAAPESAAAPESVVSISPVPLEPPLAAEPVPDLTDLPPLRVPRESRKQPVVRVKAHCRFVAPGAESAVCNNENLAALDRNAVAFYNQSLQFGAVAKRGPLLDSRVGFLLRREECRSNACLQRVHLEHLRELSAIVEKREPEPPR